MTKAGVIIPPIVLACIEELRIFEKLGCEELDYCQEAPPLRYSLWSNIDSTLPTRVEVFFKNELKRLSMPEFGITLFLEEETGVVCIHVPDQGGFYFLIIEEHGPISCVHESVNQKSYSYFMYVFDPEGEDLDAWVKVKV